MINVEHLNAVIQKPHYRIERVNVQVFGPWTPMYELRIKIRGRWVFVTREHIILNTEDGRLSALIRLKDRAERFNSKLGYYKLHGHGDHPLNEFNFPEGKGLEDFTRLTPYDHQWLWNFGGNHKHYSAAFTYLIWDRKLAGEVRGKLKGLGLPKERG